MMREIITKRARYVQRFSRLSKNLKAASEKGKLRLRLDGFSEQDFSVLLLLDCYS